MKTTKPPRFNTKKAIEGQFDYINKKQNEQQTLKLLNSYLANGKLNPKQAIIIQYALKHSDYIYNKFSHNIGYKATREYLLKLVKLQLLHQSKRSREFIFIAPTDLEQRVKH